MLNFMKVRPVKAVKAELFRTDRRTGRHDEVKNLFRNFAKTPKNALYSLSQTELQNTSNRFEKIKCYIQ